MISFLSDNKADKLPYEESEYLVKGRGEIKIGRTWRNTSNTIDGQLDEVAIWKTNLTEAQVIELYGNQYNNKHSNTESEFEDNFSVIIIL